MKQKYFVIPILRLPPQQSTILQSQANPLNKDQHHDGSKILALKSEVYCTTDVWTGSSVSNMVAFTWRDASLTKSTEHPHKLILVSHYTGETWLQGSSTHITVPW